MSRTSTLPKRLQPMLATLTDAPFDDPNWVFEDKFDGFQMVVETRPGSRDRGLGRSSALSSLP